MREITYRQALQEALREEMQRDEAVFLLGEDIAEFGGSYKVTSGLLDEFGAERVGILTGDRAQVSSEHPLSGGQQAARDQRCFEPQLAHELFVGHRLAPLHRRDKDPGLENPT